MTDEPRHPEQETNRSRAKALLLKTIGASKVAEWCGVGEATVYQWLSRGTEEAPIPNGRIPAILQGARREGIAVDIAVLWPAMGEAVQ